MFVFVHRPLDPPSELFKPIEHGQLNEHIDTEDDVLRLVRIPPCGEEEMIEDVSEHQNGEIQGWKLTGEEDEIDKMDQLSAVSGTSRGIRT